ncbi:hypothetical protein Taro_010135 [Colocasia esculenta]|uniref:Uncharacterized protein n=1 Tax=Colocasia esculenta TaxID=4460 RepID=A0A843U6T7_COLES|nr:hypothetical protein [Colocasia esculenta]
MISPSRLLCSTTRPRRFQILRPWKLPELEVVWCGSAVFHQTPACCCVQAVHVPVLVTVCLLPAMSTGR